MQRTSAAAAEGKRRSGFAEATKFWRRAGLDDVYFFKARYVRHVYSWHAHSRYALGAIEAGAQSYRCRGSRHDAAHGTLFLINPDDPHDGSTAQGGSLYRIMYVGPAYVSRALAEAGGREDGAGPLPLFSTPSVHDPSAAHEMLTLHDAAEGEAASALEVESRLLALVVGLVGRHASSPPACAPLRGRSRSVRLVQDYLRAHLTRDPSLAELVQVTGLTRFHLIRTFAREVGMPPHQFLTHLRLREAVRLLRLGEPAASVAAAVGFVDQSHFIKRFRGAYGITPRQYASCLA